LGEGGRFLHYVQGIGRGCRFRIRNDQWLHRQGAPLRPGRKRRTQSQAIGRSRGGITTKVLALIDALGNLVDFRLLPGQAHDLRAVPELIEDLAFDADCLRANLDDRDITPVIPPKSNRRFPAELDTHAYKWRPLIENYFGKIQENRGIAMRSCKTDQSFQAFISLAATFLHLK
jgi:transposase